MIGFKISRKLKAHLVSTQLSGLDVVGRSKPEEQDLLIIYVKI